MTISDMILQNMCSRYGMTYKNDMVVKNSTEKYKEKLLILFPFLSYFIKDIKKVNSHKEIFITHVNYRNGNYSIDIILEQSVFGLGDNEFCIISLNDINNKNISVDYEKGFVQLKQIQEMGINKVVDDYLFSINGFQKSLRDKNLNDVLNS